MAAKKMKPVGSKPKVIIAREGGRTQTKLERNIVLASYFHSLFGKASLDATTGKHTFAALQRHITNDADPTARTEGFNDDGHSYISRAIFNWEGVDRKILSKLDEYDARIRTYVDRINSHRETPITLKYFQYLAVLYTEIYLDRYFNTPGGPRAFLEELNEYAYPFGERASNLDLLYDTESELRKLAFWMATGSGKTHLVAINYLQFLHYNKGAYRIHIKNIVLVTPTSMLTDQHLDELKQSGIPAERYRKNRGSLTTESDPTIIQVLEITKLTGGKAADKGERVDTEDLGSRNLVLIDEGHKGSSGEEWRKNREDIAKNGFAFEYSATFGQAIRGDNHNLLSSYGKAILFDYHYRYFYRDGFGKDYQILNVDAPNNKYDGPICNKVMLANLLAFYEQICIFQNENTEEINAFNIELPLWVFLGSSVRGENSDILNVLRFLQKTFSDKKWAVRTIQSIMEGKSELRDKKTGIDFFARDHPEKQRLMYLRHPPISSADEIYADIIIRVFHSPSPAPLHVHRVKKGDGEIGLKCGGSTAYFGVINVGAPDEIIKEIKEHSEYGIKAGEPDQDTNSLFEAVKTDQSSILMLIGAKKFIEGWSSYRVSTMGLLNVGQTEGTQIIQIFGRGIRLKGKKEENTYTLKRSSATEPIAPQFLPSLETLNIFGVQASYMDKFSEFLEEENPPEIYVPFKIPTNPDTRLLSHNLLIPYIDKTRFKKDRQFSLTLSTERPITVVVDLMPRIQIIESQGIQDQRSQNILDQSELKNRVIPSNLIDALNWTRIYHELMDFKRIKQWDNLIFSISVLQSIITTNAYTLWCPPELISPKKYEDLQKLEDVVIDILKAFLTKFYSRERNLWGKEKVTLKTVDNGHENFEDYIIEVRKDEDNDELVENIRTLIRDHLKKLNNGEINKPLRNIYFDRHLFQPLLAKYANEDIRLHPAGLNEGEEKFITDLRTYVLSNPEKFRNKNLFVMRNLPKKGVGFFDVTNFFPDFIIWATEGTTQHLLFVDPKGLGHIHNFDHEKIRLCSSISEYDTKLKEIAGNDITLNSAILSATRRHIVENGWRNPPQSKFEANHIYFIYDDEHYIEKLLKLIKIL
ncbi:MAG: DEAD/DEAH box helicase family protein [Methanoregula sp.]|nr:DEAD/DEAH box helicase family protein [Methanoregula sp.]